MNKRWVKLIEKTVVFIVLLSTIILIWTGAQYIFNHAQVDMSPVDYCIAIILTWLSMKEILQIERKRLWKANQT